MSDTVRCFIGLGSNLEQPIEQIKTALFLLQRHSAINDLASSSLYISKPMGPAEQPDYVNAVAMCHTALAVHELLDTLQAIEQQQGRVRQGERWGPRTLDLDLLSYGNERIDTERLRVPHPGIPERSFVLLPWVEIAPDFVIPGMGVVRELAANYSPDELHRLEKSPL